MDPTFYKDQRNTRVYCKNNFGVGRALKTTQSLKGKYLTSQRTPNQTERPFEKNVFNVNGKYELAYPKGNTEARTQDSDHSSVSERNEDTDLARRRTSGRRPGPRSRPLPVAPPGPGLTADRAERAAGSRENASAARRSLFLD